MKTRSILSFFLIFVFSQFSCSQKSEMPVYPGYQEVVKQFFTTYTTEGIGGEDQFVLAKKPDGWHVMIKNYLNNKISKDELFWSRKKQEYIETTFPHYVQASIDPNQGYLLNNAWAITASSMVPYWGYNGWEMDVINEFAAKKNLCDSLLNAVGRAYSSYARNLISGSENGDPELYQKLPKGLNALSPDLLNQYLENRHKASEFYSKLFKQNPGFETFVSNIYNVYSNDVMDGFLTLRYFQNEETAKKELKKDLYDPFYIEMAKNYLNSCDQDAILFTNGDMDTYPLLYVQETENFRKDVLIVNLSLLNLGRYIYHLINIKSGVKPLKTFLDAEIYKSETKNVIFIQAKTKNALSLKNVLEFVASTDKESKLSLINNELADYIPTKELYLKLDNELLIKEYPELKDSSMNISLNKNYLTISQFCLLDILCANNFDRPIYFGTTVGRENFMNLEPYLRLEGLAYKLTPVWKESSDNYNFGTVDSKILYEILFNKLAFDNKIYGQPYSCENKLNMLTVYRTIFSSLIKQFLEESNVEKALFTLDKCMEFIPENVARYDYPLMEFIEAYFKLNQMEKAKNLLANFMKSNINLIETLNKKNETDKYKVQQQVYFLSELLRISQEYIPDDKITGDLQSKFEQYKSIIQ